MLTIQAMSYTLFESDTARSMTSEEASFFAVHAVLYCLAVSTMIFLSENFLEKQALLNELLQISTDYRLEVQKLQQFIEETPLGVIFVEQGGLITHINEKAIRIYRQKVSEIGREQLLGQPFSVLSDDGEIDVLSRLIGEALSGRKTTSELVQRNDKMFLKSALSIRDIQSGQITGAAIILHDVTELTRLRDEITRMERLSLVGQMAASITHEIRNPMAVIRGFVQLMRERSPQSQQDYFRIVIDELDRANSIINDFLSLAQNRVIEKMNCSLHDIINEILPLIWADANLRGQSVELELAERMPLLMLNEKEMKQLILNLARNGMEAMAGSGTLRLRTAVDAEGVELRVIDSGIGIPKEKLERLFEPFYTTKTRGTGLGLPLCLSIVERHGGQISVNSSEGKGTEFIVRFRRQAGESEAAATALQDR
jgi:PAS domain S-box-containing protein